MKIGMEMTGMLQGAGMLGDGAYATNCWDDMVSLPFCFLYSSIQHQRRGANKGSGVEFHTWVIYVQRLGRNQNGNLGLLWGYH